MEVEGINITKDVLIALLTAAYDTGFHRAAKDGMAGFHPKHVERCHEDGLQLAKEVAETARTLWPLRT